MGSLTALPATFELLVRCWQDAEQSVRKLITERYSVHDEVFISRLFYGELSARFSAANGAEEFSQSVLTDLQRIAATPRLLHAARGVTAGIVARVSYHEPQVEVVTAGDMGFTVVRPSFKESREGGGFSAWLHEQGLLCQAKRQTADGQWGRFTSKQKRVLPQRMSYLALLLYGYSDPSRKELAAFRWKSCSGYSVRKLTDWLRSPHVAETMASAQVIDALANGRLGTNDEDIIRDVICAGETAYMRVEITWPDGHPPSSNTPPPTHELTFGLDQSQVARLHQHNLLSQHLSRGQRWRR